jgi:hypothetical protein
VARGAVEFVVLGFPGTQVDPGLAPALREQVSKGVIRIIDLLFVQKATDGTVRTFELEEIEHDAAYSGFEGVPHAVDGLIGFEDVADVSADLPPGTTALVVLYEHAWMRDLRDAVEASGGQVLYSERIPGAVVDAVAEAAAAEARATAEEVRQ